MNLQGTRGASELCAEERKVEKGVSVFECKRGKQVIGETRVGNFRDNGSCVQRGCIISRHVIITRKANPSYLTRDVLILTP